MVNIKAIALVTTMVLSVLLLVVSVGARQWATADEVVRPDLDPTPPSKIKAFVGLGLWGYCTKDIDDYHGGDEVCFQFQPDCKIYLDDNGSPGDQAEDPRDDSLREITKECNDVRGMEGFGVLAVLFTFFGMVTAIIFLCRQPKCSAQMSAALLIIGGIFGMLAMALFAYSKEQERGPIMDDDYWGNGWVYGPSFPAFTVGWLLSFITGCIMICLGRLKNSEPAEEF